MSMQHIALPVVEEPVTDLRIALSLLDYPYESDGIADRDFFLDSRCITLTTCVTATEKSRERSYIVSEQLARTLVSEEYVRDDSIPGIIELYSISDKGIQKLEELKKQA